MMGERTVQLVYARYETAVVSRVQGMPFARFYGYGTRWVEGLGFRVAGVTMDVGLSTGETRTVCPPAVIAGPFQSYGEAWACIRDLARQKAKQLRSWLRAEGEVVRAPRYQVQVRDTIDVLAALWQGAGDVEEGVHLRWPSLEEESV